MMASGFPAYRLDVKTSRVVKESFILMTLASATTKCGGVVLSKVFENIS